MMKIEERTILLELLRRESNLLSVRSVFKFFREHKGDCNLLIKDRKDRETRSAELLGSSRSATLFTYFLAFYVVDKKATTFFLNI